MFGGPVIVLSKYDFNRFTNEFWHTNTCVGGTWNFYVAGGNTKREQGRKVQESNVAAAKVSDNMVVTRRDFHAA